MKTCIEHQGSKDKSGYGWVRGFGERKSHRVAYVKAYGPIPNGLWVLHKCHNAGCINPEHLYLGTAQDNANDRIAAGHHKGWPSPDRRGTKNPNYKHGLRVNHELTRYS